MLLGPHAISLLDSVTLNEQWYQSAIHILECTVGLLIGTELVWKRSGKPESKLL